MEFVLTCSCYPSLNILLIVVSHSANHQNTADPAYELVDKPTPKDVQLDKNPAYSVADTDDTSEDHHYDFIADSAPAKIKTQIQFTSVITQLARQSVIVSCVASCGIIVYSYQLAGYVASYNVTVLVAAEAYNNSCYLVCGAIMYLTLCVTDINFNCVSVIITFTLITILKL